MVIRKQSLRDFKATCESSFLVKLQTAALQRYLKVGHSPFKKKFFICSIDSPSKMMKNAFYLILKALFTLKIFKLLS